MSKVERFHIDGDKQGSKNGWRLITQGGTTITGSWKTGEKEISIKYDPHQLGRYFNKFDKLKYIQNKQIEFFETEKLLKKLLATINNASIYYNHPYFIKKGLSNIPARVNYNNEIIVPIYDPAADELISAQLISETGTKRFIRGLKVKDGCAIINKNREATNIFICEGLATGLTIYEAMGRKNCCIYCALSAMNLCNVAHRVHRYIASKIEKCNITIAADNDTVGMNYATEAMYDLNLNMVFPPTPGDDFNDLFQRGGVQAVLNIINPLT